MKNTCGAKTRQGTPCRKAPIAGKTRCRKHGGCSTGPAKGTVNHAVHGIYLKHLSPEEAEAHENLELGTVDAELRFCRIKLSRAIKLESEQAGLLQVEEEIQNVGENAGRAFPASTTRLKVKDYESIIDRLLGRICRLELARKALDTGNGSNDDITGFEVLEYPDEDDTRVP